MCKITSTHIKTALLSYWRFKRQFSCGDEVSVCYTSMDIMVDTGGFLFEIEVKISKSDLVQGEKRKDKHERYGHIDDGKMTRQAKYIPNQYFICVPSELVEVAKEWCDKTNSKYGVLEYKHKFLGYHKWEDQIKVARRAKFLHENPITTHQKEQLIRRMSSSRAVYFQNLCNDYVDTVSKDYQI